MGREALEGLRFLASLPFAGTGQREGGGFSCINKRIISHPVKVNFCWTKPWTSQLGCNVVKICLSFVLIGEAASSMRELVVK